MKPLEILVVGIHWVVLLSFVFLLGTLSPEIFSNDTKWTDILSSFGSILAGLGTLVAAYAALCALSTWKNQFIISNRYNAIVDLEKAYLACVQAFDDYKDSFLWQKRIKYGTVVADLYRSMTSEDFDAKGEIFEKRLIRLKEAEEFALTFIPEDESWLTSIHEQTKDSTDKLIRALGYKSEMYSNQFYYGSNVINFNPTLLKEHYSIVSENRNWLVELRNNSFSAKKE